MLQGERREAEDQERDQKSVQVEKGQFRSQFELLTMGQFLAEIGLERYAEVFEMNGYVTFVQMVDLTREQLAHLAVEPVHVPRLLGHIREQRMRIRLDAKRKAASLAR